MGWWWQRTSCRPHSCPKLKDPFSLFLLICLCLSMSFSYFAVLFVRCWFGRVSLCFVTLVDSFPHARWYEPLCYLPDPLEVPTCLRAESACNQLLTRPCSICSSLCGNISDHSVLQSLFDCNDFATEFLPKLWFWLDFSLLSLCCIFGSSLLLTNVKL